MESTEAIVIYSFPYKDRKFMVEMFTREHGRMTFMYKRRLEPLSVVDIVFDGPRQRLQSVEMALVYRDITRNPYKLSISFFVAEFLRYATRDEPRNAGLYDYVRQSLEWLDLVRESFASYHLVLMMRVAQFLGFAPDVEGYRQGMLFDMREARFVSAAPLHGDYLGAAEAESFVTLMRMNFSTMRLFRMTNVQRNAIADRIVQYYRLHVASFPEMRSLDVLRSLM